jgi:hypothetical protein
VDFNDGTLQPLSLLGGLGWTMKREDAQYVKRLSGGTLQQRGTCLILCALAGGSHSLEEM